METVIFRDLGLLDYQTAWEFQQKLLSATVERKLRNRPFSTGSLEYLPSEHHLLFVEHAPVYTLGRSGSMANLLLTESELIERGIQFFPINRGGDITFHGPGQLVGYPILDLECFFTDVHRYVRTIEEVMIRVCSDFGIVAHRLPTHTGVWIEGRDQPFQRKICAIGVHLSRWVTLHGWAFNVAPDLNYFKNIVPCGISDPDKTVTSLEAELGEKVDAEWVKNLVKRHFADLFECCLVEQPV